MEKLNLMPLKNTWQTNPIPNADNSNLLKTNHKLRIYAISRIKSS